MSLKKCHECGQEISTTAKSCPHCGASPKKTGIVVILILIIIGIVIISAAINGDSSSSNRQNVNRTQNTTGKYRIKGEGWIGCISREQMDRLGDYIVQADKKAYLVEVNRGLINGECVMFENNETVYLMDTAVFSGLVNVRRPGETITYWTNTEAINK